MTIEDVKWLPISSAPMDGTPIAAQRTVRYLPYKPEVWLPLEKGDRA